MAHVLLAHCPSPVSSTSLPLDGTLYTGAECLVLFLVPTSPPYHLSPPHQDAHRHQLPSPPSRGGHRRLGRRPLPAPDQPRIERHFPSHLDQPSDPFPTNVGYAGTRKYGPAPFLAVHDRKEGQLSTSIDERWLPIDANRAAISTSSSTSVTNRPTSPRPSLRISRTTLGSAGEVYGGAVAYPAQATVRGIRRRTRPKVRPTSER